jgi:integrase
MRWDEINFGDATWTIPATKQKNGISQVLPLVSEALELLKARRPSVHSEWVFPARAVSKTGHLTEPKRGWERVCQRAKLSNLRIHDLRRSLGSWQAKQGHSLIIIGKTLNHQSPQSTAIYSRLDVEPVRHAMQDAVSAMRSHISP